MFVQLLLFPSLLLGVFGSDERIVNGVDAEDGEFPFAVSLRQYNEHSCGGTILNERYVLTAAHCVMLSCWTGGLSWGRSIQYGSNKISSNNARSIKVKKVHCNNFIITILRVKNDYAVLELASPIPSGNWKPVKLARTFDGSKSHDGVIIGWGRTGNLHPVSKTLKKADVTVYDDNTCSKTSDIKHHICLGSPKSGACNGDSGGALLVDGVQVGIASYILADCGIATPLTPNVYARVSSYYPWIAKVAGL